MPVKQYLEWKTNFVDMYISVLLVSLANVLYQQRVPQACRLRCATRTATNVKVVELLVECKLDGQIQKYLLSVEESRTLKSLQWRDYHAVSTMYATRIHLRASNRKVHEEESDVRHD